MDAHAVGSPAPDAPTPDAPAASPLFCSGGGCTAKLGPRALERVLSKLPRPSDPDLIVGFDSSDDAAVVRLTDELALVHTTDFFPPVVSDPYTFGQIAAANALSDVWAMGGTPRTALNIVAFSEGGDLNQLGAILAGGSERVAAAGASLAGGHSITGDVLYGLSVTGTVHPARLWRNDTPQPGDALVLTKPLGVGIACAAHRMDAAPPGLYEAAVASMIELNRRAAELLTELSLDAHAVTDITGFGLAGHLLEMLGTRLSASLDTLTIPVLPHVRRLAEDFFLTAAAQRNRTHAEASGLRFEGVPFGMQELLFDAQTSGGLLIAMPRPDADAYVAALAAERAASGTALPVAIIGTVTDRAAHSILVR